MRWLMSGLVVVLVGAGGLSQPEEKLTSGPQRGKPLPGSFAPLNINGAGKDRQRCLVTRFGNEPTVIVFAREPATEKDSAVLTDLLKKLDQTIKANKDEYSLGGFVVFLSKDVRGAASADGDTAKLVEEAQAHEALVARLRERAKDLSDDLIVACYPRSPTGYKIDDRAALTALLCRRQVVRENWAFGDGQMTAEDVSKIVKAVEGSLAGK